MSVLKISGTTKFSGFVKAAKKIIYSTFGFVNESENNVVDYGSVSDTSTQQYDYGNI